MTEPRTPRKPKPKLVTHYGYLVFFKNQRWEVYARTQLEAKELAIKHFKLRKSQVQYLNVVLASKGWAPATHEPIADEVTLEVTPVLLDGSSL